MSSFLCENCGASIVDTPNGYTTGCAHYPLPSMRGFRFIKRGRELHRRIHFAARSAGQKRRHQRITATPTPAESRQKGIKP